MITDSIGNYLTSIRNAIMAQHKVVQVPASNVKREDLKVEGISPSPKNRPIL